MDAPTPQETNSDIENAMAEIPLTNNDSPSKQQQQDHTGKTTDTADISITHTSDSTDEDDLEIHPTNSGLKDDVVKSQQRNRRKIALATIGVLCLLALALGLGFGLGDSEQASNESSSSPSAPEESATAEDLTELPSDPEDELATLAPQDDVDEAPIRDDPTEDEPDGIITGIGPQHFREDDWEWPILVGMNGQAAADALEFYYPGMYDMYILPDDAVVTMDYDIYRIRIFVNVETQLVSRAPMIG